MDKSIDEIPSSKLTKKPLSLDHLQAGSMRLAMPARPGLTQNVLLVSVVFPGGGVVGRLDLPGERVEHGEMGYAA